MKTPAWLRRFAESLDETGKPLTVTRSDGRRVTIYTDLCAKAGTSPVRIVEEKVPEVGVEQ